MKYGERLYRGRWYYLRDPKARFFSFRYRIDPVPFIRKRVRGNFSNWYKTPRVMNEKRQSFTKFCRAKRNARNLPNPWDDYLRSDIRSRHSWKKRFKCRKQWEKSMVAVGKLASR